jgi:uncharacterized YigZ family protein
MQYKTIKNEITVKQTIKKSIFIGTIAPVETVEEAKAFIARVKEKYRDANHNAFAYRVDVKNEKSFFSDDREPSKTAGAPIYNAIRSAEITNVAIVVTRYFSGIKLGIGGLIQAYGETARYAIEQAEITIKTVRKKVCLELPYNEIQLVLHFIEKFKGIVLKRDFKESVTITVEIDEDLLEEFSQSILSRSSLIKIKEI